MVQSDVVGGGGDAAPPKPPRAGELEWLDATLSAAGVGVWDWDIATDETRVNDVWLRSLGYERADFDVINIETTWFSLVHPDDLGTIAQLIRNHIYQRDDRGEFQIRMRHKDGSYRWLRGTGQTVARAPDGQPLRALGTVMDVEMLLEDDMDARGFASRFRALHAANPDAILFVDEERRIQLINPAFTRTFGYELWEIQGQTTSTLYGSEATFERHEPIHSGGPDEPPYTYEETYVRKDGSMFLGETTSSILYEDDGSVKGRLGIIRDVTEREAARADLEASEARFRRLFESSGVGVGIFDLDGTLVDANQAYTEMTGRDLESLRGMRFDDYTHPEDAGAGLGMFEEMQRGERRGFVARKRYVRPDGGLKWVQLTATVIRDEAGEAIQHMSVVQDVDAETRAAQELEQTKVQLELAVSAADYGAWSWLIQDDQLTWDARMWEMFDLEPTPRASYGDFIARIHPDDRDATQAAVDSAVEGEKFDVNYRIVTSDGSIRHIHATGAVQHDARGTPLRFDGLCLDITEQHRAAEALAEAEAQFAAFYDQSAVPLALTDLTGAFISTNDAFADFLGYEPGGLTGVNFIEITHPDDHDMADQGLIDLLEGRSDQYRKEKRYLHKDGHAIWIDLMVSTIRDSNGDLEAFASIVTDIHARKMAEMALAESQRLLSQAFDAGQFGTWEWDVVERTMRWDHRMREMHGVGPDDEVNPMTFQERVHEDDIDVLAAQSRQSVELGLTLDTDYRIRIDDEIHHILLQGAMLPGGNGTPSRLAGIAIDITERKHIEGLIAEQEEHFRTIVQSIPSPLVISVLGSDELVFSNVPAAELLGRDRLALEGMHLSSLFADPEEYANVYEQFAEEGVIQDRIVEISRTGDMDETWVLFTSRPARWEGQPAVISMLTDYTEIRAREAEGERQRDVLGQLVSQRTADLAEALKVAETASRAKSTFLANMSHELRTPLNAILGFSELLMDDERFDEETQDQLHLINEGGERLFSLLTDVLEMSRIEAGRVNLNLSEVNLVSLIDAQLVAPQRLAASRNIDFVVDVADDLPTDMCTDTGKLRQVLGNLVDNAVRYTAEGEVRVTVAAHTNRDGAQWLDVEVRDTGIGMSTAEVNRSLEPFGRGAGITGTEGGSGLGLAISRRYVELMEGELRIESQPRRGTTASFSILLHPASVLLEPAQEADDPTAGLLD